MSGVEAAGERTLLPERMRAMITPRDSHVVNLAERMLNKDLDGDGDIGVAEQPYVAYGAEFSVGTCSCGLPTTTCVSRLLSGLIILPLVAAGGSIAFTATAILFFPQHLGAVARAAVQLRKPLRQRLGCWWPAAYPPLAVAILLLLVISLAAAPLLGLVLGSSAAMREVCSPRVLHVQRPHTGPCDHASAGLEAARAAISRQWKLNKGLDTVLDATLDSEVLEWAPVSVVLGRLVAASEG